MRRTVLFLVTLCVFLVSTLNGGSALAARGEGGCVITPKAPIYETSKSADAIGFATEGDCAGGVTTALGGAIVLSYQFEEFDGRIHVTFIKGGEVGHYGRGWMNAGDLAKFTYECGCGSDKKEREKCSPFVIASWTSSTYNTCFKEARKMKLDEIRKQGSGTPASLVKSEDNSKRAENTLQNKDILSLVKVELDDKLIISKIKAAKVTNFDLSTEGIVALKTAKVSNAVIDAMMMKEKIND